MTVDAELTCEPDYARTLREWQRRFEDAFETDIVPALKEAYPELKTRKEIEVFRRKWIYYYEYCAVGVRFPRFLFVLGD